MSPIVFSFRLCDIKLTILTKIHWGHHQGFVKRACSPLKYDKTGRKRTVFLHRRNKGLGQVASSKQRSLLRKRRSVQQTLVRSQGGSSEPSGRNTEAQPCDWRSPDKTTTWSRTEEKHQEECSGKKKYDSKLWALAPSAPPQGFTVSALVVGSSFKDTQVPPVKDACSAQTVCVRWFQCGNHNYLLTFFFFCFVCYQQLKSRWVFPVLAVQRKQVVD